MPRTIRPTEFGFTDTKLIDSASFHAEDDLARNGALSGKKSGGNGIGGIGDLFYSGQTIDGTGSADFILAQDNSGGTLNGNGGSDIILGDMGIFYVVTSGYSTFDTALNLDTSSSRWSTDENSLFGDDSIPHLTAYVAPGDGRDKYFEVQIAAGETLIVDIDGGSLSLGSAIHTDTIVEIYNATMLLATGNNESTSFGGLGSVSPLDAYLVFTAAVADTYFIRIRELDFDFEGDEEFLVNFSLTGHSTGTPDVSNNDTIHGGTGADQIMGAGGNDSLFGDGGRDTLFGGSGNDTIVGGSVDAADVIDGGTGNDSITGGDNAGGDMITGGSGADTIFANGGNDTVDGGSGTDGIRGGTGNDSILGGLDSDVLFGDDGNDTIDGGNSADILGGGEGNDSLDGGSGSDSIAGGTGNDSIRGGSGDDTLAGEDGDDTINGGLGFFNNDNLISGGDGNDSLIGAGGVVPGDDSEDTINGDAGNDTIEGNGGGDVLNGGDDIDTVSYAGSTAVNVRLNSSSNSGGYAAGDVLSNFEVLIGSANNDTLDADGFSNATINGGAGDDRIIGGLNNQLLLGGDGDDRVDGGDGSDRMYGEAGNDTLDGGADIDLIAGGADDDVIRGNIGNDTLFGDDGNDTLYGNSGTDSVNGGAGNDKLVDKDGGDTLTGDTLVGGTGDDLFITPNGTSTIVEAADGGFDTVRTAVDYVLPDNVEALLLRNADGLVGTGNSLDNTISSIGGNDSMSGLGGKDVLFGAGGDDTLDGGGGSDTLYGGNGSDVIVGGGGADTLFADKGLDMLTGGSGADVFRFKDDAQFNTITDFGDGADTIHLANYREENGGAQLTFDQLLITQRGGGTTRIELDLDRNGIADVIDLDGDGTGDAWHIDLLDTDVGTITGADFIF